MVPPVVTVVTVVMVVTVVVEWMVVHKYPEIVFVTPTQKSNNY